MPNKKWNQEQWNNYKQMMIKKDAKQQLANSANFTFDLLKLQNNGLYPG